jgi:3-oxoacyl-[acyl-carrier protein] reductase
MIFISSVVGLYGGAGQVNYAASKAGLVVARSIATAGRPQHHRRGRADIDTDMTAACRRITTEYRKAIPGGRFAAPDGVAGVTGSRDAPAASPAPSSVDSSLGMGH